MTPALQQTTLMAVVTPVILIAMAHDIKARRLPNRLCVIIALVSLCFHGFMNGQEGILQSALGLLIGFALMFLLYLLGLLGAGDVKFNGALGAFVGSPLIIFSTLIGAVLAGVCSAFILLAEKKEKRKARWAIIGARLATLKWMPGVGATVDANNAGSLTIPYGIYLGTGAIGVGFYQLCLLWSEM